ncbi:unnamed protein product [Ambrosiozyma monospora]|uniref:Unnamed protein product n=1 Tax=Ambrosiozyma monospora TaxID=43982 RepID=A0A9W6Z5U4_AMBMO|nr:unnamed protein product [Ambrosiozyma monospora]
MSQSRYDYDEKSETWPYFALTGLLVPLIPVTISTVVGAFSSNEPHRVEPKEASWVHTYNEKDLKKYKTKKKQKNFITKKLIFLIIGWALAAYLIYQISTIEVVVNEANFDPWKILGIDESATEKSIKAVHKLLSKTMHPDKRIKPVW